jgi:hypothetical protein
MQRIEAGRAHCALCREVIRPDEDAFITPDFLADESDPFWRFADAPMHRACFLVWDRRKAFVARYNRAARLWVAPTQVGRVALGIFVGQALVLLGGVVTDPASGGLWPLGIVFLAIYSMLALIGAVIAVAVMRHRAGSRPG